MEKNHNKPDILNTLPENEKSAADINTISNDDDKINSEDNLSPENINTESNISDDNNSENNLKLPEGFDIVDFALKHNTSYSVKKNRVWTKVLAAVLVLIAIVGVCVMAVFLSQSVNGGKENKNPLIGGWQSGDSTMYIGEDIITIGDTAYEYLLEDNNIIALKIYQGDYYDYFKLIYEIKGDKLTIIAAYDSDNISRIEYVKKA